ncbi:MAG: copper transporter, partial [Actinomycetota bacterium]
MISFRFHLVSLVAAFLALAVGIVIGTTLADRAIVSGLRNRVDTVSANLDERQAENDRLRAENDRLESFLDDGGPAMVDGALADEPVLVIAEEGIDRGAVEETVELLGEAGATVRGVVTVRPEWSLESEELQAEVEAELEASAGSAPVLQSRLARLLVTDLASSVAVPDDGTGILDRAVDLELVDYEPVDEVVLEPDQAMSVVVLTGTNGEVGDHLAPIVDALLAEGAPTVVASVFDPDAAEADGEDRSTPIVAVIGDGSTDAVVVTVDDAELAQGRLAVVFGLARAIDVDGP